MTDTKTLEQVGGKRGYLLPYHKMLAAYDGELLAKYDAFYTRLTLTQKTLTDREKEFVWVTLLVAVREGHGTLHLRRADAAGLPRAHMHIAINLAGIAESRPATAFAKQFWQDWAPDASMDELYFANIAAARGDVPEALVELALATAHASKRDAASLQLHIKRFFAAGGKPAALVEALAFLLLPCGGPTLIDAVDAWAEAAPDGKIPSPF